MFILFVINWNKHLLKRQLWNCWFEGRIIILRNAIRAKDKLITIAEAANLFDRQEDKWIFNNRGNWKKRGLLELKKEDRAVGDKMEYRHETIEYERDSGILRLLKKENLDENEMLVRLNRQYGRKNEITVLTVRVRLARLLEYGMVQQVGTKYKII